MLLHLLCLISVAVSLFLLFRGGTLLAEHVRLDGYGWLTLLQGAIVIRVVQ